MRKFARSWLTVLALISAASSHAQVPNWFEVEATEQPLWLELPGRIEAVAHATVSAQTSGRIIELPYDVNDIVPQGAVIVRFTDTEQRARMQQAEAALHEAKTRADESEKELNRLRALRQQELVSAAAFDNAQANFTSARARVQQAQAALAAANEQLEQTVVRAPYAGIVQERYVEIGELATPGKPLLRGLSLEDLRVVSQLPQAQLDAAKKSPAVALRLADGSLLELGAASITVAPEANLANASFLLRVQLPTHDYSAHNLYPGSWTRLRLQIGSEQSLVVPRSAVLWRGELSLVWLRQADQVQLQQVRVRPLNDSHYVILSGLSAGQVIASDALQQLQQGAQ